MDLIFILVFFGASISFTCSVYVFYHTCQEYYHTHRLCKQEVTDARLPKRIDVIVQNPDEQITVGSYVYKNNQST